MFTPPSSPLPSPNKLGGAQQPSQFPFPDEKLVTPAPSLPPPPVTQVKRHIGRRLKWTAISIPLLLILLTISVRSITHQSGPWSLCMGHAHVPLAQATSLSPPPPLPTLENIPIERRQTPTTTSTTLAGTAQPLPTIPTNPVLPTPFPQPFDKSMNQNFSSQSCLSFFNNMTSSAPFRTCRPFSLLSQSSSAFALAQNNLTLLNSIVYGTCTTTLSAEQCSSNMAWFASSLKTECSAELSSGSATAIDTLAGLQSYDLMRQAGCLADSTNTYCYLNAVHNSNPVDIYYYQLPLGLTVPKSSTPTCSSCTKNLLALYADALDSTPDKLSTLAKAYNSAEQLSVSACGGGYARSTLTSTASQTSLSVSMLVLPIMLWILTLS